MPRRMLINAQNPEELRVAIVDGARLGGFEVAVGEAGMTRGNIYRGVVVNVQPALNAAFVDIGLERHAFLAQHDIVAQAYHRRPSERGRGHRIEELLERGKPIIVQVTKDGSGQKGPAVTTSVSMAGRYLVLSPFDDTLAISRKVEDEETRRELRERAAKLKLPQGCGVIIRTNAIGQTAAALDRDLAAILRLWKQVHAEGAKGKGPCLLYSDQDLVVQALRDLLDSTITEVLIDDAAAFEKAGGYVRAFMPRSRTKLIHYQERMPLFSRHNLEPQIDAISNRVVELPGGGSIVIDRTEALTAIDVNSGRAKGSAHGDEMLVKVNLEAAHEVARQLRLRDIGGLVVVDLIDMRSPKHRRDVEKAFREAMKSDKARFSVGKISPNGLLEINRQKIKQALELRTRRLCPTCAGLGTIASAELVGLRLLRRIQTEAAKGGLSGAQIELHPELADAFQNQRRHEIVALEQEFDIRVEVIAATSLHRSEERVQWRYRESGAAGPASVPLPAVTAADAARPEPEKRRAGASKAVVTEKPRPEPEDEGDEDGGRSQDKKRRRRRGGRRHGKAAKGTTGGPAAGEGAAALEAGKIEPVIVASIESATVVAATDAPAAESGVGAAQPEAKSSRRRRRPRRHRSAKKPKAGEPGQGAEG